MGRDEAPAHNPYEPTLRAIEIVPAHSRAANEQLIVDIPLGDFDVPKQERVLSPNDIYEIQLALQSRSDIARINEMTLATSIAYNSLQKNIKELRNAKMNRGMLILLEGRKLTDSAALTEDDKLLVADYQTIKEKIELIEKNRLELATKLLKIESEIVRLHTEKTAPSKIKIKLLQDLQEEGQAALRMPEESKEAYEFMGFEPGDEHVLEELLHERINLMTRRDPVRSTGEFDAVGNPITDEELDQGLSALG